MSIRIVKLSALSSIAVLALLAGCSASDSSSPGADDLNARSQAKTPQAEATVTRGAQASRGGNERIDGTALASQLATAPEGALGVSWTRDEQTKRDLAQVGVMPEARRSANMSYHGGKIMPTATTKAFFKGTSWGSYSGDKITGIDSWYTGFSGSHYEATVSEYTGTNGTAGSSPTTHQGHYVDTGAETSKGSTSAVLAEVCAAITASGTVVDASGNGYYPLYSDQPRGSAGYCAFHGAGTCGGKAIQFAFFWNLDGDAGCDPADTSGLHSQGLAALANVSGHELAEAMSDPASPGAWYDSSGNENGDKCAWTWGGPLATFSNGSQWKVQGEWSNKAFTAGTGYANRSGQKGCIGGL